MTLLTAIFLILSAFLMGIAVTGFVVNLRQGMKPEQPKEGIQTDDLISLRKDPVSGALEVVIAGKTYHSASELNGVQRTLAGYAVHDLNSWLSPQGGSFQAAPGKAPAVGAAAATATAAVVPVESAVPAAVAATAASEASIATAASEAPLSSTGGAESAVGFAQPSAAAIQPAADTTKPAAAPAEPTGDLKQPDDSPADSAEAEELQKRKRGGLIGIFTRALAADISNVRPIESIAVQVNQILQKNIKGSPLESRGISLIELPGQEMVVMIGLDKYDSVSAVPDDEIRALLQSAVNEWLARSTK